MRPGDLVRIAPHVVAHAGVDFDRGVTGIILEVNTNGWRGVARVMWSDGRFEGWDEFSLEVISDGTDG